MPIDPKQEKGNAAEPAKVNPFPWFPWWPKVEESHLLPIMLIGIIAAAILAYFLF